MTATETDLTGLGHGLYLVSCHGGAPYVLSGPDLPTFDYAADQRRMSAEYDLRRCS